MSRDTELVKLHKLPENLVRFATTTSSKIILIKEIPPTLTNSQIRLAVTAPHLRHISFGLPDFDDPAMHRMAWCIFEDDANVEETSISLSPLVVGSVSLPVSIHESSTVPVLRTTDIFENSGSLDRIHALCCQLVELFDRESSLEPTPLQETDKTRQVGEMILYMRTVHLFCFLCGKGFDSQEELLRCCGAIHILQSGTGEYPQNDIERQNRMYVGRSRLFSAADNVSAAKSCSLDQYWKQQSEESVECLLCSKLFISVEYILKHISLKHPDVAEENKRSAEYRERFLISIDRAVMNYLQNCMVPLPAGSSNPKHRNSQTIGQSTATQNGSQKHVGDTQKEHRAGTLGKPHQTTPKAQLDRPIRSYAEMDAPSGTTRIQYE